jgi:RimJ/RimL family protein N-acetyltransferase
VGDQPACRGPTSVDCCKWLSRRLPALAARFPAGSVDIDILIGETDYIGKGIGSQALRQLVEHLRQDTSIPLLGLSPSVNNSVAQRVYRKIGFSDLRVYDAPGYGLCLVMVLDLKAGQAIR